MGVIKLGFISFIVFALIITGFSLFIPSHIRISKAIDINADKDSVMTQLNDAASWKNWFPGGDTVTYYLEENKILGISTSNNQALKITGTTDSTVFAKNVGPKSKMGESGWNVFSSNSPNTVTVQWYMDFHLRWYPWEKFSSLLLEKRYGPMMEQGLENLKNYLDK